MQYTYDTLARLTLAETVGPQWGQSFSYDGWGNLLSKGVTKGAVPVMNLNVDGNTNRISSAGFGFDAAGNMTTMPFGGGSQTITYDRDGRVASVTNSGGTESYTYDASNRRVVRNNGSQTEVTFYGIRGEKLGRYLVKTYADGSKGFDLIEQYFYFGGRMTAKRPGSQFLTTGITRLTTDRLSSVGDGSTYYPYGEEKTVTANDKDKFATYYRDSVSGLDYAQNRYYSSVYGRFLSADQLRQSAELDDPQSWNRYVYVGDDPVNWNDPEGLAQCPVDTPNSVFVCANQPYVMSFTAAISAMIIKNPPWIGSGGQGALTTSLESMRQMARTWARAAKQVYERCRIEAISIAGYKTPEFIPDYKQGEWLAVIGPAITAAVAAYASGLGFLGAAQAFVATASGALNWNYVGQTWDAYKLFVNTLLPLLAQCDKRINEAALAWAAAWSALPVGNVWDQ